MTTAEEFAPAKVNLTLHVTGQRADGYHLLDSLVVFAGHQDRLTARPSRYLTIDVSGPFSAGVPCDDRNLVLRAAHVLRARHGVQVGAALHLEKNLPHAAGIGSGSSDAAAALRLLARVWNVPLPDSNDPLVLALGADVPVCLRAPAPTQMTGIGETLTDVPPLPSCAMVMVNPQVALPTGRVFAEMHSKTNPAMPPVPSGMNFRDFAAWLSQQRNDMQPAAAGIAPEIIAVLSRLRKTPGVEFAGMSGSGSTCVALVADMDRAVSIAGAIQVSEMRWWVAPAPLLT
jgi:4-diphosphocytidyl-2-C-methyl-D-erythritol kinase